MPREKSLVPVLFDWKTKDKITSDTEEQLAAYEQADFEETGEHSKYGIVINIPRRRPHRATARVFKLGKRALNKFLKLRAMFDDVRTPDFDDGALSHERA